MEEEKCKVHGTILKSTKVPISYGLPAFDEELFEAREKLFPNAKSSASGGCVLDDNDPSHLELLVCEDCRQIEKEWREANGRRILTIEDIKF